MWIHLCGLLDKSFIVNILVLLSSEIGRVILFEVLYHTRRYMIFFWKRVETLDKSLIPSFSVCRTHLLPLWVDVWFGKLSYIYFVYGHIGRARKYCKFNTHLESKDMYGQRMKAQLRLTRLTTPKQIGFFHLKKWCKISNIVAFWTN